MGASFLKSNFKLSLLNLVLSLVFTGCYYPKVTVLKEEKAQIVYSQKSRLVYSNQMGRVDTVSVYTNRKRGFESNFDFWWYRKISETDTLSSKRKFGKTFFISSIHQKNKPRDASIDLFLRINYRKSESNEGVVLSIDEFKESYVLKNQVADTLIFTKEVAHPTACQNKCVKKLLYSRKKGIVQLEQSDGAIWELQ